MIDRVQIVILKKMKKLLNIIKASFLVAPFSFLTEHVKAAESLKIGDSAPFATLLDNDGNSLNLEKTLKQGTTLLFFYPKANTGG